MRFGKTQVAVVVIGSMPLLGPGRGCAPMEARADSAAVARIESAASKAEAAANKAEAAARSADATRQQAAAAKASPVLMSRVESDASTAKRAAVEAKEAAVRAKKAGVQAVVGGQDGSFLGGGLAAARLPRLESTASMAAVEAEAAAEKAEAAAKSAAATLQEATADLKRREQMGAAPPQQPSAPQVGQVPEVRLSSKPTPVAVAVPRPADRSELSVPKLSADEKIIGDDDLAVVVGIEKYRDLPPSDFSADDARLVKDYLVALGFRQRNIQMLLNDWATQSSIRKLIETWLPNRVKPTSRVLVYYSGHGAPDPQSGDAYLVPYDGDPNYLGDTGYLLPRLYDKLGALPVQEAAVVLDACFSGAGGRSVLAKGARPLVMMKESTSLPANLVVLAAAKGAQISTSSAEKGHGVLTYYFLHAIKDGKSDLAQIYAAITPLVEDEARALNVSQTPSLLPESAKVRGRFRLRN